MIKIKKRNLFILIGCLLTVLLLASTFVYAFDVNIDNLDLPQKAINYFKKDLTNEQIENKTKEIIKDKIDKMYKQEIKGQLEKEYIRIVKSNDNDKLEQLYLCLNNI